MLQKNTVPENFTLSLFQAWPVVFSSHTWTQQWGFQPLSGAATHSWGYLVTAENSLEWLTNAEVQKCIADLHVTHIHSHKHVSVQHHPHERCKLTCSEARTFLLGPAIICISGFSSPKFSYNRSVKDYLCNYAGVVYPQPAFCLFNSFLSHHASGRSSQIISQT